jgi:hypothetical protein
MSDSWYYVLSGERQGPVAINVIEDLFQAGQLNNEDYIWCKGFENWTKIKEVEEFNSTKSEPVIAEPEEIKVPKVLNDTSSSINFSNYEKDKKCFYIKIGADRGQKEVEYGPFSIDILKNLYDENRINAKTFMFTQGMPNWSVIADIDGFETVFNEVPPMIEESDKRAFNRLPFIARMFVQNNQNVFEGICRDVSVGGMQVLIDNFPSNVGDQISINVHPENTEHSFVASGSIVRLLEGGQGFSFRFIDLSNEALNSINSYISNE